VIRKRWGHLVVLAAVALSAGCGAQEQDGAPSPDVSADLERIKEKSAGPVYWLGPSFEGLPLTHSEGGQPPPSPGRSGERAPGVPGPPATPERGPLLVYGECNGEGDGDSFRCRGPQVQLQHWPIASASLYPQEFSCTRTTIRGVPAAQFDGFEIYTGHLLVRIYAPSQAQARRAAAALRPLGGSASAREPLPAPAIDIDETLRRCALDSVDAKLAELREDAEIPLLWVGRGFEELPLFRAEGDGWLARFMYGGCETPEIAGSCYPALTIEVTPVADRRPTAWDAVREGIVRCDRLRIRGAEAAFLPSAQELVVFTGDVAVLLRGPDLSRLRRAADALQPFGGAAPKSRLDPPSQGLIGELRRVCGP
jgi:hypothetical protein